MRRERKDPAELLRKMVQAAGANGTTGRMTQAKLCAILLQAVRGLPPEVPLPSFRQMAQALMTTPVTLHRAVAQLVRDGVLTARERSGIYTASVGEAETVAPGMGGACCFATDSTQPHQVAFWRGVREEYRQRYPETALRILAATDTRARDAECDGFERNAWSPHWPEDPELLDLARFASGEFEPLGERLSVHRSALLHYRVSFLICNPELMQSLGLPLPAFQNFQAQTTYLQQVAARCREKLQTLPPSAVYPISLMGAYVASLLSWMREGVPLPGVVREALQAMVEQSRCFQYHHAREDHLERFLSGELPLLAGHSGHLWQLRTQSPDLPLHLYPVLAADGGLVLQPLLAAVNRASRQPLEALRVISLLAEEDRYAYEQCGIPASRQVHDIAGCPLSGRALTQLAEQSMPLCPPDQHEHYLIFNVFSGALWRVLEGRRPVEDLLPLARETARSYLHAIQP